MSGRTVTVKKSTGQPTHGLRYFKLGDGFDLADLRDELDGYIDVALGRTDPPNDNGPMTMMEFANAVYARLAELEVSILREENDGIITKGSRVYKFRTGELRAAQDLFGKMQDLGSRRVTYWMEGRRDQ